MQHRKTLMLVLTALFAALTAIGAFFKIPFALAAISLQFLFTAMAGILLGAGYGALSQGVYVLIGLVGVPIFALGGGFSYVLQPTFGYLLGFLAACWVMGVLAKKVNAAVAEKRTIAEYTCSAGRDLWCEPPGLDWLLQL